MAGILTMTFFFLIHLAFGSATELVHQRDFALQKLRDQIANTVLYVTKSLESFNDEYIGKSVLGTYLHYKDIKPRLESFSGSEDSRGMKKIAMGLIPLIFHIGATSTWMVLTTILAAKSVFIGIVLLVFKIAVSSAKVGSFFTALKGHSSHGHHHEWSWSPTHEHHGYRSLTNIGPTYDLHGWAPVSSSYKTLPLEYLNQDKTDAIDKIEQI